MEALTIFWKSDCKRVVDLVDSHQGDQSYLKDRIVGDCTKSSEEFVEVICNSVIQSYFS